MKAIVVADENWAIGRDGGLLAHLPGDLKYFKEKTLGGTVIMGRATLESLPGAKPLPGRKTIVLSRDQELAGRLGDGAVVVGSRGALFDELVRTGDMENAWVAGGANVYQQLLLYCDELHVTKLQYKFDGADKFIANIDALGAWEKTWESEEQEEKGIRYRFTIYKKK